MLATANSPIDARTSATQSVALASATPTAPSVFVQQRDANVPELPFPDNPDPNQCGIPTLWGGSAGWLDGTYAGQLIEPTVLLYDSHERMRVTGAVPSGTQVLVEMYQANPVLDFYYVRVNLPDGLEQG
jgi:hypothetical protein